MNRTPIDGKGTGASFDPADIKRRLKSDGHVPTLAWAITKRSHFAKDAGGRLYRYEGGVYCATGEEHVTAAVKRLLQEWGELGRWSSRVVGEVVQFILADSPKLWERPPKGVLNVKNGLLDLLTVERSSHSSDHLSGIKLPVQFDPEAECPEFDAFVREVVPDDYVPLIWEMIGWIIGFERHPQKAFLLLGPPGTGKSTLLEVMRVFLGTGNVSAASLHRLESNRFATSALVGVMANFCADLPSARLAETAVFKAITGGDAISAERKFEHAFNFTAHAALIFSANHLPVAEGGSEAYLDRWIIVPFERRFRGTDREMPQGRLIEKLTTERELSGILNKAIVAYRALHTRGTFHEPKGAKELMEEFRHASDPVYRWLKSRVAEDAEGMIGKAELRDALNRAARLSGWPILTGAMLARYVETMFPSAKTAQRKLGGKERVHVWLGISLKPLKFQ